MANCGLGGLALTLAGLLTVGITTAIGIGSNVQQGEGIQTGRIVQFARKGALWETYEGVVALENSDCEIWQFSLDRSKRHGERLEGLASVLNEYTEQQKSVKLYFTQYYAAAPWQGETLCYVTKVELIK